MIAQDAERQNQQQPQFTQPKQEVRHAEPVLTQQHPQLQTNPSAGCTREGLSRQQHSSPSAEVATAAASPLASPSPPIALSQHAHPWHRTPATVNPSPRMHGAKRSAADMYADDATPAVSHNRKQQGQRLSHRLEPKMPGQEMQASSQRTQPAGQQGQQSNHFTQLASQARQRQKPIHGTKPALTAMRQEQIPGANPTVLTQQTPGPSHHTRPTLLGSQHPSQQDAPLVPLPSLRQEVDDMDGSFLNDTVGAIFIDASGDESCTIRLCLLGSCSKHHICLRIPIPL